MSVKFIKTWNSGFGWQFNIEYKIKDKLDNVITIGELLTTLNMPLTWTGYPPTLNPVHHVLTIEVEHLYENALELGMDIAYYFKSLMLCSMNHEMKMRQVSEVEV